ncbi:MAG: ABC transporter ATP-binding protein [Gemmatimonadota bacterium]
MIEIRGVRKILNAKRVLDGVDLEIREGETLVIMGPSGTGKSVLLKHIVGIMDPDEGDLRVDGVSVPHADGREIRKIRSKISYVFQNSALFDSLSAAGNIRLGLPDRFCDDPAVDCEELIAQTLRQVNLEPEAMYLMPAELSGGMQKRVAIARAVVAKSKYILYDEPTTGLDPVNAGVINRLIERLNHEIESTSVIVTHDVQSAFQLADRIALLSGGKIRAQGSPEEMRASENELVREFLSPRAVGAA